MSRPRIVVVGSSNIDMVVKTDRIPAAGETRLGGEFVMVPGGKGANQAVCAAKLGAEVTLVARVGDDVFGEKSLANFKAAGIDTAYVVMDKSLPSGVALIAVDEHGENAIVVAPGGNSALSPADVDAAAPAIAEADAVVLQLEIPRETVEHAVRLAKSLGRRVVLNPAPVRHLPRAVLPSVDVLVPNEHEAAALLGQNALNANDIPNAAARLRQTGAGSVVITLGSAGAYVSGPGEEGFVEALKVKAVDTTAAGDAFTASLACGIAEGRSLREAAEFAARVAAITVTRMGAQSSMPSRDEVDRYRQL